MKNVAIIEDNLTTHHLVKSIFESDGFTVTSIYSGENLKEELSRLKCDLVLTDILLPGLDGVELINIYKAVPTPIIVMSSMDVEDARYFANAINAIGFISKNGGPNHMLQAFKSILHRKEIEKLQIH